ncbi:MAG: response regulator, partial [Blautia wexlerae]
GYRATEMIRGLSDKDKATIPIIAMTANAFEEDRRKALAKGMNGHIAKPVDIEKMREILQNTFKR